MKTSVQDENFAGHCCEWKLKMKAMKMKAKMKQGNDSNDLSSTTAMDHGFSGLLHVYEFGVLMDSPLDGVTDLHGFARDDSGLPSTWHGCFVERGRRSLWKRPSCLGW